MAAIRSVLSQGGRNILANPSHEKLSNEALKISGTSREGKKIAITDERLSEVVAAVSLKDEGVAIGIQLARYIGLRAEEVVQSAKSLKTWKQTLAAGENKISVVFGSKGGRARDVKIFEREKVMYLLEQAISYASENNGKCSGQQKLTTALEFFQNNRSDSFGVKPPLY